MHSRSPLPHCPLPPISSSPQVYETQEALMHQLKLQLELQVAEAEHEVGAAGLGRQGEGLPACMRAHTGACVCVCVHADRASWHL